MNILEKMALIINAFYIIQTATIYRYAFATREMYTCMGKELHWSTKVLYGPIPLIVILICIGISSCTFLPALKEKKKLRTTLFISALIGILFCQWFITSASFAPMLDMASGI